MKEKAIWRVNYEWHGEYETCILAAAPVPEEAEIKEWLHQLYDNDCRPETNSHNCDGFVINNIYRLDLRDLQYRPCDVLITTVKGDSNE